MQRQALTAGPASPSDLPDSNHKPALVRHPCRRRLRTPDGPLTAGAEWRIRVHPRASRGAYYLLCLSLEHTCTACACMCSCTGMLLHPHAMHPRAMHPPLAGASHPTASAAVGLLRTCLSCLTSSTFDYCAPELLLGHGATPAADGERCSCALNKVPIGAR